MPYLAAPTPDMHFDPFVEHHPRDRPVTRSEVLSLVYRESGD